MVTSFFLVVAIVTSVHIDAHTVFMGSPLIMTMVTISVVRAITGPLSLTLSLTLALTLALVLAHELVMELNLLLNRLHGDRLTDGRGNIWRIVRRRSHFAGRGVHLVHEGSKLLGVLINDVGDR